MTGNTALPPGSFDKEDTGDDLAFYAPPRLVTHIDEGAVEALTDFYRELLPEGGRVLDLMSSWVSHLPDDHRYGEVTGHGMNADELAANPRLDHWFVQDLNADPTLRLDGFAFDAALNCVGVQYLQRRFEVFAEVRRVLMADAPLVVSYANRCFSTKARSGIRSTAVAAIRWWWSSACLMVSRRRDPKTQSQPFQAPSRLPNYGRPFIRASPLRLFDARRLFFSRPSRTRLDRVRNAPVQDLMIRAA